jgi:hypothetical protein
VKIRPFHIAASLFLAASVLFSQVGLGYFHDKHDAHEHIDQAHKDQTQLHKHGEHCKVCSIDLFFSLYLDSETIKVKTSHISIAPVASQENLTSLPLSFIQGRAPPASIL